jgi:hypothetical protein
MCRISDDIMLSPSKTSHLVRDLVSSTLDSVDCSSTRCAPASSAIRVPQLSDSAYRKGREVRISLSMIKGAQFAVLVSVDCRLWGFLGAAVVGPSFWAKERTYEGKLLEYGPRQFGGFVSQSQ